MAHKNFGDVSGIKPFSMYIHDKAVFFTFLLYEAFKYGHLSLDPIRYRCTYWFEIYLMNGMVSRFDIVGRRGWYSVLE